jgi:FkbH-like protein
MINDKDLLSVLAEQVATAQAPSRDVRTALAALTDPMVARRAGRLLKDVQAAGGELRPVRLGLLATCTVGPLTELLHTVLVGVGALPDIALGDYGNFEMSLAAGQFAADGDPDLLCLLLDDSYFLPGDFDAADVASLTEPIADRVAQLRELVGTAVQRSSATVVLHTVPLPAALRNTLISWRAKAALARAWHQLNAELLALAEEHRQVVVLDLVHVLADLPAVTRDPRLHSFADLPYTDAALYALARELGRVVQARLGLSRKVLALDLDNTLWGGVIGEVGAHSVVLGGLYPGKCYRELQLAARRLREQGVILVLASKNDSELVEQALAKHPEMLLRSDAFSVLAVNWSAKDGNLRQAAESLSLSTESFVFMDDSSFERGAIASELPEVALVAADGDPAHLVNSLLKPGFFDVLELTATDRQRPALYRSRALRSDFAGGFASSEDYLQALEIELTLAEADEFAVPRVAQMAARTNQFNLTGIRYDEASTAAMSTDPDHLVVSLTVHDRFGDEGIVGAMFIERREATWQVLNFVLSCRVLGRGIELAAIDWVCSQAAAAGASAVQGRFVPSSKNSAAADFWRRAGFTATDSDGVFHLDLQDRRDPAPAWISVRERKEALA